MLCPYKTNRESVASRISRKRWHSDRLQLLARDSQGVNSRSCKRVRVVRESAGPQG